MMGSVEHVYFSSLSESAHLPTGKSGHRKGGDFLGVTRAIPNTQQPLHPLLEFRTPVTLLRWQESPSRPLRLIRRFKRPKAHQSRQYPHGRT